MSMFKKAIKSESKLRLAIAGPSGSGKTFTALAVATALADGRPVALVDTEHGSASKYADLFGFDVAEMHPPFHPDKFGQAITEAAAAGYAVIILDSLTHAWNGTGGMLDLVDEIAKRKGAGNTFAAWKDATPIQNRLIDAIVGAPIHVIATMRSKQDYAQDKDEKGRTVIRKVGMAPQQRDGFEYEFDVFVDLDIDHNGIVSKTRCPALTDRVFAKPGKDLAGILGEWLKGAPVAEPTAPRIEAPTQAAHRNGNGHHAEPTSASPIPAGVPGFVADWQNAADAYAWAVQTGACDNEMHARGSMKKIIDEQFGGRLTRANQLDVFVAYYRRQAEKLTAQGDQAWADADADDPFADAGQPAETNAA